MDMTLFLCGDVMLGRGIDQVLPFPGDPVLYESFMRSAIRYVSLAQEANGPIPRPVGFPYVWGDAIGEISRMEAQARIINLETSIASTGLPWPAKEIHYRMHPGNAPCLAAAGIGLCVLANNHVLDWGIPGLLETLEALDNQGIKHAGAGRNLREARAPAIMEIAAESPPVAERVMVFGCGSETSGIPPEWAATSTQPGLYVLETRPDLGLMYFPVWNPGTGALAGMRMTPMQTRRFQTVKASHPDAMWLEALLNSEGGRFGTRVERDPNDVLTLRWE
jgi:poly-gamma-glutamate capsule biosynthesis protein CapA/YwtB (metallophosphatase superfamily)